MNTCRLGSAWSSLTYDALIQMSTGTGIWTGTGTWTGTGKWTGTDERGH